MITCKKIDFYNDYYYFYGGPLSNFWAINNDISNTSEKWFMMYKALYFNDINTFNLIAKSKTPKKSKSLGRTICNYDEGQWNYVREGFMMASLRKKYEVCQEFRDLLNSNNEKYFVEASPYDRIWGVGFSVDNAPKNWRDWGQNLLGRCLTKLSRDMKCK